MSGLAAVPSRRLINALLSATCRAEDEVRWPAIEALGRVVAERAAEDVEKARLVLRRLMWSLNDESGAIGWGAPEAMAEILAALPALAPEFAPLLISYLDPEGNYLKQPLLQRGALWAAARLAQIRPDLAARAADHLRPFLRGDDPHLRALAAWTAGLVRARDLKPELQNLLQDEAQVRLYREGRFEDLCVAEAAAEALTRLG